MLLLLLRQPGRPAGSPARPLPAAASVRTAWRPRSDWLVCVGGEWIHQCDECDAASKQASDGGGGECGTVAAADEERERRTWPDAIGGSIDSEARFRSWIDWKNPIQSNPVQSNPKLRQSQNTRHHLIQSAASHPSCQIMWASRRRHVLKSRARAPRASPPLNNNPPPHAPARSSNRGERGPQPCCHFCWPRSIRFLSTRPPEGFEFGRPGLGYALLL